eukprot:9341029-Ditylum_brightwellii.AAC.1
MLATFEDKFDALLEESEQTKERSKKMEDWQSSFEADQKKMSKDQEKKISKKLEAQNKHFDAQMISFGAKLDAQDKKLEHWDEETKLVRTISEQNKQQKHGVDKNVFDENMQDRDTLWYRDNQVPDDESDSLDSLQCPSGQRVQVREVVGMSHGSGEQTPQYLVPLETIICATSLGVRKMGYYTIF